MLQSTARQRSAPAANRLLSDEASLRPLNLQRTPENEKSKPAPHQQTSKADPKDVVVILNPPEERDDVIAEAAVLTPDAEVLSATSVKEMVEKLKTLKVPAKTLYLMGHSTADGDIVFETPNRRDFVPAAKIADRVKDVVQVENIDFHGCAVGVSPAEIDKLRAALKAKKATGSTCELMRQVSRPIVVRAKAITDRRTIDLSNPENRKVFDKGLKNLRDLFTDGKSKCIINDSEDGYFRAHGKLVAVWANPESIAGNNAFDKSKSICYGDLKHEKVDPSKNPVVDENQCKLVEVE
jgi:hypothetical protein